jgi:hypothetical protein
MEKLRVWLDQRSTRHIDRFRSIAIVEMCLIPGITERCVVVDKSILHIGLENSFVSRIDFATNTNKSAGLEPGQVRSDGT